MPLLSFRQFCSSLGKPRRRNRVTRQSVARPRVESLEERSLPAVNFAEPIVLSDIEEGAESLPTCTAVADFNGDTWDDIAIAATPSGSVNLHLSNGDGSFRALAGLRTNVEPQAIAVGDFNEDHRVDLLVANSSVDTVQLFLGNGDGSFASAESLPLTADPRSMAVGDVNADTKLDFVVLDRNLRLTVFLGAGNGTFTPGTGLSVSEDTAFGSPRPLVQLHDLNGDSRSDVILAIPAGWYDTMSTITFVSEADGHFTRTQFKGDGGAIQIGDINKDAVPDLVLGNKLTAPTGGYGFVTVLPGKGDGTFGSPIFNREYLVPAAIALADFDNDLRLDLAAYNGGVSLLRGTRNAGFQEIVPLVEGGTGSSERDALFLGDFNGDTAPDLLLQKDVSQRFLVLLNLPAGASQAFVTSVYADLLGRLPDAAGLNYWSELLDRGQLTRGQVVQQIQGSPETLNRMSKNLISQLIESREVGCSSCGHTVSVIAELASLAQILSQGGTLEQLEAAILGSNHYSTVNSAFAAEHGDSQYLTQVYQDLLGRAITATEKQLWLQALASGASRTAVVAVIQGSSEADAFKVQQYSRQILQRELEPAGLSFFVGQLQQGISITQVATQLLASQEYYVLATAGAYRHTISAAYNDLLGRSATDADFDYWQYVLTNQFLTTSQAVEQITASVEYRTRQIQTYYSAYLNRTADSSGLSFFVAFLNSGGTLEQVQATLLGSAEYFANRGSGSNEGFLTALYQDVLRRKPDSGGRQVFLESLDQGTTREQVAAQILGSAEYRTRLVRGLYQDFLGRDADTGGLAFWVNALANGLRDEQLIGRLVASEEYVSK